MSRDEAYLLDMLTAAREVECLCQGITRERFLTDRLAQYGIMHLIQIIGEASRMVSPELKREHPEIPWAGIVGMRHRLVHEYFRILPERVWEVVQNDLRKLAVLLEPLVPPEKAS